MTTFKTGSQRGDPLHFTGNYHQVTENVALRVLTFLSQGSKNNPAIVIVGGLATILESLQEIVRTLVRDHTVYYLETREKNSSMIRGETGFDIETMGRDIACIIEQLGLKKGKYALMGYSFGATAIADGYRFLTVRPLCVLFMEPTPVFHYPAWSLFLIRRMGKSCYCVLLLLAKWYLKNFLINKKEDFEMFMISVRALDHADPAKLRNSILAIANYEIWPKLEFVDCPVLVVGTSKDTLHLHDETDRMVKLLKNCTFIDLETNIRTHSAEMGKVIRKFIRDVHPSA